MFDDCSGCELTDICLAETPCLNGGTCILVRAPNDYRCDCPEAAEGARCEGIWFVVWVNLLLYSHSHNDCQDTIFYHSTLVHKDVPGELSVLSLKYGVAIYLHLHYM